MRLSASGIRPEFADAAMHLSIVGPEVEPLPAGDLRRLFAAGMLSARRHDRLAHCARVMATCNGHVVGLATYVKVDAELQVPDLAIDRQATCRAQDVLGAILDGLELACLAGGGHRILVRPPPAIPPAVFRIWGYSVAPGRRRPGWVEKRIR
jgi:hypothetical protein